MLRYHFGYVVLEKCLALAKSASVCLVACQLFAYAGSAEAATHRISPSKSSLDCAAQGVRAGDNVILTGRSRGALKINNCVGTASNPILISNDTSESGPLVVNQSGDGFQTQCTDCEYVIIDGTGKWAGAPAGDCGTSLQNGEWRLGTTQCGIVLKCSSGSPHSALRLSGSTKHVTVKGLEIDSNFPVCKTGIGLSVNDHGYSPRLGEWREGIRLLNNYVHRTEGEGIYVGHNQKGGDEMPLRNNEIAFNVVDSTGCDAINFKSALSGSSSIHHNYVTNTGRTARGGDSGCSSSGIALFEAGFTDIYSNYVEAPALVSSGAGHCISQLVSKLSANTAKVVPVRIYNNVLRNCKGDGIRTARNNDLVAAPDVSIYNNTIIPPIGGMGISIGSAVSNCSVHDNIVAGKTIGAKQCDVQNNAMGDIASQKFRDPDGRDYRLTVSSPAVDLGTGRCPDVDLIGIARPQQGLCDQGAFEFSSGSVPDSKPMPPAPVTVE